MMAMRIGQRKFSYKKIALFSIALLSFVMHFSHFSKELMSIHVWRQAQTQSTIVNFYEEDMNILNPRRNDRGDTDGIFRMEFPLMQWLVALIYKIFGRHLLITRLFMFVLGLFSVVGMYKLLEVLFHKTPLALMGAWAFNFSPSFYYYTINPLPDNMALCCGIWGLALFFRRFENSKENQLATSGLLLSMGALCKLPFIIYYVVPLVYFLRFVRRREFNRKVARQAVMIFGFAISPLVWYAAVIPQWGRNPVLKGLLAHNESAAQWLDYFQHNLISTLPELLLNYGSLPFFLAGFYFLFKRKAYRDSRFLLLLSLSAACLLYYFFEANAIAKIHDYYLFPFYPLLFILVAYGAYHLYGYVEKAFAKYFTLLLLALIPLFCHLRMQNRWNPASPGFNKDLLLYKTELRKAAPKDALVVAGNDASHFIMLYYIDKKGWGFHGDKLSPQELQAMIKKGTQYLYTDSPAIYTNKEMLPYLDELVLKRGSIRVYRLR